MEREFTRRRSTVGAFAPSFLLSFFELFETWGRKSTQVDARLELVPPTSTYSSSSSSLSLPPSLWLPSFLPSFFPFHFEWPLPPSREPQPSSVSPLPPPLSSLPSQTSFPAVKRKNPLKKLPSFSLLSISRSTRFRTRSTYSQKV